MTRTAAFSATALFALFCALAAGGERPVLDSLEAALPTDGRPSLLVFFSAGCSTCFDELLEMARFVRGNGLVVEVIGISGDTKADLEAFVEKYSVRCPVVREERGRVRRLFKVELLPFKVVLAGGTEAYRDDSSIPLEERMRRAQRCLIELGSGLRSVSRS